MPLQHLTRKRAGHLTFLLLVVLLVLVPVLVESRASPEPKAKPQRDIENYTDDTEYGEEYGKTESNWLQSYK